MPAPDNACACDQCRSACTHKPGWFTPDQIAPLAAALGLTEKELFDRHLQIDWWNGTSETGYEDVFVLSPAVTTGTPGDMFDNNPRGTCRWFIDDKCAIHEAGKPTECAAYHHDDDDGVPADRHKAAGMAWNNPEAQAKVRELYGSEPYAGSWSIFDELGLGGF